MKPEAICCSPDCDNPIGEDEFACSSCLADWAEQDRIRHLERQLGEAGLPPRYRSLALGQVVQRAEESEEDVIARARGSAPPALAITKRNGLVARDLIAWKRGGFFIAGQVGVGKTTLLAARFVSRVREGELGFFLSVPELVLQFRVNRDRAWTLAVHAAAAGVLLLDDLGRPDDVPPWLAEPIVRVIARRTEFMLPTLITSNYGLCALEKIYGDYARSRLEELCGRNTYILDGPDFRRLLG